MGGTDWFNTIPCIESLFQNAKQSTIEPCLATGWEVTPDMKGMILTLRKGVKFHDGTDFNAEAVKFNLDLQLGIKTPGLANVTSVDIIDDYTVRLNLTQWDNALVYSLAAMEGMIISPTAVKLNGAEWAKSHPVGTGAFKFVEWKRDVSLTFEKFADYWQKDKPYLDGLEIIYISDAMTSMLTFQAGEADLYWGSASTNAQPAYELLSKGYQVDTTPSSIYGLSVDSNNPSSKFADKRVREAIEYAVDKNALVKAVGYGIWEVLNQPSTKASFAYNPDLEARNYDPAKAKSLLALAGYSGGFKTTLFGPPVGNRDAMVIIQGYLKAVGIDAQIEIVDSGRWASMMKDGWKDGLVLSSTMASAGNFSRNILKDMPPDSSTLISVARPPGFTDLVNQALAATNTKDMIALNQKIVKALYDDVTYIPIWVGMTFGARQVNVYDAELASFNMLYWHPENAWLKK